MITTEAWVLEQGPPMPEPGSLTRKEFEFDDLEPHELLLEPLVGCWEANMTHAIDRDPVDVARQRNDKEIVLGNSGMCRVAEVGSAVDTHEVGELVFFGCCGKEDPYGYAELIHAYDSPGTVGTLSKLTKLPAVYAFKVPPSAAYSLRQWAAYPRYWSAWSNHKVAMACLRSQLSADVLPHPHVWSWGGGVGLAQMQLAADMGCRAAMIASTDARLEEIEEAGIVAIDRREFSGLKFDPWRSGDAEYKAEYSAAEKAFLSVVKKVTGDEGVHIFVDNIGTPVHRATLRALARQGVIATCGWKDGMLTNNMRAVECIARHTHVHTHAIGVHECQEVIEYQAQSGWIAPEPERVWGWDEIPELAAAYRAGDIDSYFPIFEVQT
ncbi:MAG: zinc-binding dehydrogenase [Actinomycetota bacterium]